MEKLGEIDSFPKDGRGPNAHAKAVKEEYNTPEGKVCTDCKRRGHLKVDCWGKCSFCGRFGHKAEVCRDRLKSDQKDALKKANYKKDKERKTKKEKTKKKIKAKKIQEYEDMLERLKSESPESSEVEFGTSGEESSDPDEQSPSTRVKKVQASKESRRETRVYAYAENITDDEVIESINNTKIASKIKK